MVALFASTRLSPKSPPPVAGSRPNSLIQMAASNRGLFCVLRKQCAEKQPYPPHPAHAVANAHMGAYAVALGGVPP